MRATRSTKRNIVALEGDASIFKEMLKLLQVVASPTPTLDLSVTDVTYTPNLKTNFKTKYNN